MPACGHFCCQRGLDLQRKTRQLAQERVAVVGERRSRSRRATVSRSSRSTRVCHSVSITRRSASSLRATLLRASARCGRARRAAARSRAGRRGCSCAAPRSGARSAPGKQARRERIPRPRRASGARHCRAAPARSATLPSCGDAPASACARRRRLMVQVLGDVRELREIAERANDRHGRRGRERVQRRFQLRAGVGLAVAAESEWPSGGSAR